uniref:Ataxin-2 C-terminal domain-containing protein n=1 Tax=Arachis hypogaea TaxID=3818 RepID=Q45W74_ARAHY|nr:unknown [Arachis hypogaea]
MALVSGGRPTLNPNAPLYIPAAFRQVEDFSPEWWQLVTTLTWYHEYWLSQQQVEGGFYAAEDDGFDQDGNDVVDLLPDIFDLDAGEDLSVMEAQLEEFIRLSEELLMIAEETGHKTFVEQKSKA